MESTNFLCLVWEEMKTNSSIPFKKLSKTLKPSPQRKCQIQIVSNVNFSKQMHKLFLKIKKKNA